MATNLQIDDRPDYEGGQGWGHHTKPAAVAQALTEYVHHLEQENVLSLFGSVDFDLKYGHKK